MESCKTFKNLLIYFDYLVKPYEFKLHNDKRNGTICGGIFSLILLSVLTFYFVVTIEQLQTQDNNNYISYIDSSQSKSDQIQVTENEIQLAFFISIENSSINQEQQNLIIREYLSGQNQQSPLFGSKSNIKLLHIQKNNNQVLQNNLQIVECSSDSSNQSQISKLFSSVKYPMFCLSGQFQLQNQFYQTNYTYLSFEFDLDNNDLATIFPNSNIYLNMIYNDDSYQVNGNQFQQSPNYQFN
ncbi:transmembrane protein, putative (macronuclear) [Tetrahymena thermophila SB210]|uniref:Transmembrane protein, putative n=1 Tax=Tetrahymena thermophila (strain SB210) TaxID=312017 RepID=W7WZH0_TETTS|nr:transmembrane protein, putative [Tetrahymena thermophila SB210]EWS70997.1 transmembrane protein, putative [Tetrahymena thermophila SB210]|eukprot:XP_012656481.1 transmembrane protein, putative [Tetrahymena thermophila SB210]